MKQENMPIKRGTMVNIVYMQDNNSISEKSAINNYAENQPTPYHYKHNICPKLESPIQHNKSNPNIGIVKNLGEYSQLQSQLLRSNQKVRIYESIFSQFDPYTENQQKIAKLTLYKESEYILDSRINDHIKECLQIQKYIQQYQQLTNKLAYLQIFCNKYHNQNRDLSIIQIIEELQSILENNQLVRKNQQAQLTYTQSESIQLFMMELLGYMKQIRIQSNLNQHLENIRSEGIRKPTQQTIKYINTCSPSANSGDLENSIKQLGYKCKIYNRVNDPLYVLTQIGKYIDKKNQKQVNSSAQLLQQAIKVVISPIYKYVYDRECQDIRKQIMYNNVELIRKFNEKNIKVKYQYADIQTQINIFLYFVDGSTTQHFLSPQVMKEKLSSVRNIIQKNRQEKIDVQLQRNVLKKQNQEFRVQRSQLQQTIHNIRRDAERYKNEKDILLRNKQYIEGKLSNLEKKLQQTQTNIKACQLSSENSIDFSNLENQYNIQKQIGKKLQQTIAQLNDLIREKEKLVSSLNKRIQQLQQQIKVLQKQKKDECFQNQGKLKSIKDEFQDQKIELQKKFAQKMVQEVERFKRQYIIQRNKQIDKIKGDKSKLAKEYDQLFNQLQEYKEKYYAEIGKKLCMSFDLNNSRMCDKAVGQSYILDETQIAKNNLLQNIDHATQEIFSEQNIQDLKNQYKKQFEEEIEKLKKENNFLRQEINQKEIDFQKYGSKEKFLESMLDNYKLNIQKMEQQISQLQKQLNKSKQNIKILSQSNKNYQLSLNSFIKHKNQRNTNADIFYPTLVPFSYVLFNKKLFQNRQEQKQILIKHISSYTQAKIIKTQLLFEYNEKNKANFHPFIDNKQYFACVVRTPKVIVAGFYPGQISDKRIMNEGGLLISVTKDRSLKLLSKRQEGKITNYRAMTYDSYYIIFGNAQLRIRTGEKILFSNYGMTTGYFDYSQVPKKVEYFLQQGDEREVQILEYECYQLFFDRELHFNQHQVHQENIFKTT